MFWRSDDGALVFHDFKTGLASNPAIATERLAELYDATASANGDFLALCHHLGVRGVLEEVGAAGVPALEVMNKCNRLDGPERRRLEQANPDAWLVSAANGTGCGDLVDAIASRLALDACRVTLHFDPDLDSDRRRIAQIYRHARVISHLARNGRVSIEADVPRRLLSRFVPAEMDAS